MDIARPILEQAVADLPPPAQHQTAMQFAPDFVNFVKALEKAGQHASHVPEPDPAGGMVIGYGHRIAAGENFTRISEQDATKLLVQDLAKARKAVDAYIKRVYGIQLTLTRKQAEMLTEFAFNLGSLNAFPKFTDAVLREDWAKASQEYVRSYKDEAGAKHLLDRRNELFARRYGL